MSKKGNPYPMSCLTTTLNDIRNLALLIQHRRILFVHLVMMFSIMHTYLILLSSSMLFMSVFALPSGPLPRALASSVTNDDNEVLSMPASTDGTGDTSSWLPMLRGNSTNTSASIEDRKPFTDAEFNAIIAEGIENTKFWYPQAYLYSIYMTSLLDGQYHAITNPGFLSTFTLQLKSPQQNRTSSIRQRGRLDSATNTVRWFLPKRRRSTYQSPEIPWPPSKLDFFQANEARIAANLTAPFIGFSYFWWGNASEGASYPPRLVYEFLDLSVPSVVASISADTGDVLPYLLGPTYYDPGISHTIAGTRDSSISKDRIGVAR